MRIIEYKQHEFHCQQPKVVKASLSEFIFDIPYLLIYNVLPPFDVLNDVLKTGGGDAGMSPGASWVPFELSINEYNELVSILLSTDLESLKKENKVRYVPDKIYIDETIDDTRDFLTWLKKCSIKYGQKK